MRLQQLPSSMEQFDDNLTPVHIVAALGLTLGGAMGFAIGWWLGVLTPDGGEPSYGLALRSAIWCALLWGLAIGGTAALTAYKAIVLDEALRRRPWSHHLRPPLSYDTHFRPAPAAQRRHVRLSADQMQGKPVATHPEGVKR